jgi:hypothetical protein
MMVEMLTLIKGWELGEARAQLNVENNEVEEAFKNLWLDEDVPTAHRSHASETENEIVQMRV